MSEKINKGITNKNDIQYIEPSRIIIQSGPPWMIKKIISKGDYNYVIVNNHPNATKNQYVLEHRIIMENYLNRLLCKNEVVHHKNGNKKDNRVENLEILTNTKHSKMHTSSRGSKWLKLKCPWCDKVFNRSKRNTFIIKNNNFSCCSRFCSGKMSRFIQLNGITEEIKLKMKNNIIEEFVKYSVS